MSRFRVNTFRGKMIAYAVGTSAVTLMLAGTIYGVLEWLERTESALEHVGLQADIVAQNVSAALVFDDREAATKMLAGFSVDPNMLRAAVVATDGTEFTAYTKANEEAPPEEAPLLRGHRLIDDRLHVFRPVELDGKVIGSVYLCYDMEFAQDDFLQQLLVLFGGFSIAVVGA